MSLFARHGRGMQLTPAGEALRARAGAILRQVEEARADLMDRAGTVRGRVVFGLTPTVGAVLATRLIERFLAEHPQVTLRVVHAFSGYLLEWLQGELDIAVTYGGLTATGVRQTPLLIEGMCLVAAADAGLSPHRAVPFADVAAHRLVLPGPAHGLRKLVEAAARDQGLALNVAVEADDLEVLKDLAQRRLGATVCPLAAVRAAVDRQLLSAAPIIDPQITRKLVVVGEARPPGFQRGDPFGPDVAGRGGADGRGRAVERAIACGDIEHRHSWKPILIPLYRRSCH